MPEMVTLYALSIPADRIRPKEGLGLFDIVDTSSTRNSQGGKPSESAPVVLRDKNTTPIPFPKGTQTGGDEGPSAAGGQGGSARSWDLGLSDAPGLQRNLARLSVLGGLIPHCVCGILRAYLWLSHSVPHHDRA